MCHLSPTVHLAWAILACGLQIFLTVHLWRYDRFKCLSWSNSQRGAFKRIMTYTYLTSVPALVTFSVAIAVLKYRNGYMFTPEFGIIPTPFQFWPEADRNWLQPLYIIFGFIWGLEIVTHLEELTFWLFLLQQGPERRDWFSSLEFKVWAIGSCIGMIGMPATAILTRTNPLKAEAWIFLVGSAASMAITFVFFIVLFKFPEFLRRVKTEGAATAVVLRLVKFHELNIIRVIFRLFMTVPLFILGIDGVLGHHIINESPMWTDMLAFFSAVGTVVSSTMTLLIFFPRSLAEDSNWRPRAQPGIQSHGSFVSGTSNFQDHNRNARSLLNAKIVYQNRHGSESGSLSPFGDETTPNPLNSVPIHSKSRTRYYSNHFTSPGPFTTPYRPPRDYVSDTGDDDFPDTSEIPEESTLNAWRSSGTDLVETPVKVKSPLEEVHHDPEATGTGRNPEKSKVRMIELGEVIQAGLKKPPPPRPRRLHPYISSFTSPIDLIQWDEESAPRAL